MGIEVGTARTIDELMRQEIALEYKKLHLINTYLKDFIENLEAFLSSNVTADTARAKAERLISIITNEIDVSQLNELAVISEKLDMELPLLRNLEHNVEGSKKGKLDALISLKQADRKAVNALMPLIRRQIKLLRALESGIKHAKRETLNVLEENWNRLQRECQEESKVINEVKYNEDSLVRNHFLEFLETLEAKLNAAA